MAEPIEMKRDLSYPQLIRNPAGDGGADFFRTMAEGAPVSLWMADASGKSTFHNQAWLDFTGRARAEMGGQAWLECVHPDDLSRCLETYHGAFRDRRKFQMEYRLRRYDGQFRWVLDMGAPCYDDGRAFCGFTGATVDITERKEAEEQLGFANTVLTREIESSPDAILVVDANGRMSSFNQRFIDLWSIPPDIAQSRDDNAALASVLSKVKDPAAFMDRVKHLYEHPDESVREEVELNDGRILERHASGMRDASGKYLGRIWFFRDITDRKRDEEYLKGRNKDLEQIAAGAPLTDILNSIAKTAEQSKSGLICSILLLERDGRHLRHGTGPSLPDFYNNAINGVEIGPSVGSCGAAAYSGKLVVVEDIDTHPFWAPYKGLATRAGLKACWSQPILSSAGHVLGTFANYYREVRAPTAADLEFMTSTAHIAGIAIERKRAEEDSAAAKTQAEIANRTKTEFLANMSHELRSPLNSVLGFSEIMKKELFGPLGSPRYQEYVEDIGQSASHLLAIINDILNISKIEAGKLELDETKVDVGAVVEICARLMYMRAAEAGIQLETNLAADLPKIFLDSRKVKQILLNLISNAVKFTPKGGKVTVSAGLNERGELVIKVADTGIGIAPENIGRALSPFMQIDSSLSRKYEGTGLGLPLSKALIELHGGQLTIESQLGTGTTVTVTFPTTRVVTGTNPAPLAESA